MPTPPPLHASLTLPRLKERTPQLKDRLLRAALQTLERDGIPGLTTRRIAREACTSTPAVYELFGDRAGLVREIFFEGFRQLTEQLEQIEQTPDPIRDLVGFIDAYRAFVLTNAALAEVMFSRPFADFDPGPAELAAGRRTRDLLVDHVRRCIDHSTMAGSPVDIAHVLLALARGLSAQERTGLLGTSAASRTRRWNLAINTVLTGLAPPPAGG